ncbi:MAG: type II toxin-antitoxin system death-on-curing family toxin [Candidatus Jorgensenbacteria bacterium]
MATNYLDIDLMEKMCHRLAVAVFDTTDDPIAPFKEHERSLLDSALNLPKFSFGGAEQYSSLVDKATVLYYTLNKNHPFRNGNKRIATASLLVFLFINNKWLDAGKNEMVEKALAVAQSKPEERKEVLIELTKWISAHIVDA